MDKTFLRFFAAMFVVGLVNNLGYVMIGVGAQAIADQYGQANLMPLFQLMLVIFNLVILVVNLRYLVTVNTFLRISVAICAQLIAYLVMALCSAGYGSWGFPVALLATVFMGCAQSLGECINLGFSKYFPADYVVGFSSGTGFAGVAGAGLWLVLKAAGLSNSAVYLTICPLLIAYWLCFYWLYKQSKLQGDDQKLVKLQGNPSIGDERTGLVSESTGNSFFTWIQLKRVSRIVGFWSMNLGSVYFLEYVIITGFADRATLKYEDNSSFLKENAFMILQFCYQFGVLCSRSSLGCFKVRKVWIITTLQAINFVIWWVEAEFLFLTEWGEFVVMLWVGCMGGMAYVNVAYLVLNSDLLPQKDKEASMNLNICANSAGILIASLFCLIFDNFIIKE